MSEKNNLYSSRNTESPFKRPNGAKRKFSKPYLTKAYHNKEFMSSNDARPVRILSEYLETESRLAHFQIKDTVVFYGSARIRPKQEAAKHLEKIKRKYSDNPEDPLLQRELHQAETAFKISHYYGEAQALSYKLTEWSLKLDEGKRFIVCSGGGPGIMEAANRGASEAGGPTIGMNISLPFEQAPNPYITENLSFEYHYFFMRKFWFVYLAKALVVFPGGFGTFDELFELLTLRQTSKVSKPMSVIIYGKEYWDSVVNFDKMVDWGVISEEDLNLFHIVDDVDGAFTILREHFEKEFVGKPHYWHL